MGSPSLRPLYTGESQDSPWGTTNTGLQFPPGFFGQPQTHLTIPVNQGDATASAATDPRLQAQGGGKGFFGTIGQWLLGDGQAPSLLGGGQYQPDAGGLQLNGYDALKQQLGDASTQAQQQYANLLAMLQSDAEGNAPSVAQQQLKQGTEANLAAQVAAANSVRGPGSASQVGQLLANQAFSGQQMAGQAATLRASEIAQAKQELIATQAQYEQVRQQYLAMGLSLEQADLQARQYVESLKAGAYQDAAQRNAGISKSVIGGIGGIFGRGAAGGGAGAPSGGGG